MPRKPLRDIDAAERLYRGRILLYALPAGSVFGGVAGYVVAGPVGAIIGIPLGVAGVYYVALTVVHGAAKSMEQIHNPSGATTPPKREYSYAQSLVMRARYPEAIEAYEMAIMEDARDPTPYFEIARLYRDKLRQPEEAITWFRRGRADAELARLVDRFPETPAAAAARTELAAMRAMLAKEHEGAVTFTEQFLERLGRGTLSAAAGHTREEIGRKMIADALAECGGDRRAAAERLQVPLEELEAAVRSLGVDANG